MSTATDFEYRPTTTTGRIANYVDTRVGASAMVKEFGRKVFPDHWSFMFGEVALYSFVILLLSGTLLAFWFDPTMTWEAAPTGKRGRQADAVTLRSRHV